ncbi:peptidoglycan-binding domain-containing protein [Cellulosimicrobium cellulans]|uniref:peptidoglycan-binding domain-containing protein n=1 Tax=Cellulosimicrobium cellulans TaxID=1710 RepID=UPI0009EC7D42
MLKHDAVPAPSKQCLLDTGESATVLVFERYAPFVRIQRRVFGGWMRIARLKRALAGVIAAFILMVGGSIAMAAPASAAVGKCNVARHGYVMMYSDISAATVNCYQNSSGYTYVATQAFQVSYNNCYAARYGYAKLVTDGHFGPLTTQAVRNVQNRHGITADGSYGPQTASVFNSWSTAFGSGYRCGVYTH